MKMERPDLTELNIMEWKLANIYDIVKNKQNAVCFQTVCPWIETVNPACKLHEAEFSFPLNQDAALL